MNSILRVICYLLFHISIVASYRDTGRSDIALEVGQGSFQHLKSSRHEQELAADAEAARLEDQVVDEAVDELYDEYKAKEQEELPGWMNKVASGFKSGFKKTTEVVKKAVNRTKSGQFGYCRDLEVRGAGCHPGNKDANKEDTTWKIVREKSKIANNKVSVNVLMLMASLALGTVSLGLIANSFTTFSAASRNENVQTAHIAWFNAALYSKTTLFLLGTMFSGAASGITKDYLIMAAGNSAEDVKFFEDWEANNVDAANRAMQDLARLDTSCAVIKFPEEDGFEGIQMLSSLEEDTNRKANDAIETFCSTMDSIPNNNGKGMWEQPGIMPKNSVCMEFSKMSDRRKARGEGKHFGCYDMMRMSNEELAFQTTQLTMRVLKSMQDEREKKWVCPVTIKVPAPTNNNEGACAEEGIEKDMANEASDAEEAPAESKAVEEAPAESKAPAEATATSEAPMTRELPEDAENSKGSLLQQTQEVHGSMFDHIEVSDEDAGAWPWSKKKKASEKTGIDAMSTLSAISEQTPEAVNFFAKNTTDHAKLQGVEFDPNEDYQAPEKVTITSNQKSRLIAVQRQKEAALHDCLSMTACQLLRKDIQKIAEKKWKIPGLSKRGDDRMKLMNNIMKRCLAHTKLVGPANAAQCKVCPTGKFGNSQFNKKGECDY